MRNRSIFVPFAGAALLVALLSGCEGAIEHNLGKRFAPTPPTVDAGLRDLARAHSQEMCDAGALIETADPEAVYGAGSVEIVDREVLDTALAPPKDDHAATSAIWSRLEQDTRLNGTPWETMGIGQNTCASDGHLYMTIVLRGGGYPGWAPGVVQVTAGNAGTTLGGITADGDTVAVRSLATDLDPDSSAPDTWLYDVDANDLAPARTDPTPASSLVISGDGSTLLYSGTSTSVTALDLATGTTGTRYSGSSVQVRSTSADGDVVVLQTFGGGGTSAFAIEDGGPFTDLGFIGGAAYDLSVSDDGRIAAVAGNGARVKDLISGVTTQVASGPGGGAGTGSALSADGRYLAYQVIDPEDPTVTNDVYLWDRTTGTSTPVTTPGDGLAAPYGPSISDDGRFVAYVDQRPGGPADHGTYLWDRTTGTSTLIAPVASVAAVSGDGSTVAFTAIGARSDRHRPVRLGQPAAIRTLVATGAAWPRATRRRRRSARHRVSP